MAKNPQKTELDERRAAMAEAKVHLRELIAMASIGYKHLADDKGRDKVDKLGEQVLAELENEAKFLEKPGELVEFLNGSGLHRGTIETLRERRDYFNRLLQTAENKKAGLEPASETM